MENSITKTIYISMFKSSLIGIGIGTDIPGAVDNFNSWEHKQILMRQRQNLNFYLLMEDSEHVGKFFLSLSQNLSLSLELKYKRTCHMQSCAMHVCI